MELFDLTLITLFILVMAIQPALDLWQKFRNHLDNKKVHEIWIKETEERESE